MRCNLSLFKFSNHLQDRMELLLDKKKTDELALEEIAELEAIGELDRIFTHMNAMLIAQNANPWFNWSLLDTRQEFDLLSFMK